MTAEQALEELILFLIKKTGGVSAGCRMCIGTVKDVDEKEGTCVVERDGSPELNDVRLNAVIDEGITDRFTVIPAVGSFVLVLLMDDTEGLIVSTSKIEKVAIKTGDISVNVSAGGVIINGGSLGGMIDIARLTDKVNELVKAFNDHTHMIPAGGIKTQGSAAAQATVVPVSIPAIQQKAQELAKGDYEDEKVKH